MQASTARPERPSAGDGTHGLLRVRPALTPLSVDSPAVNCLSEKMIRLQLALSFDTSSAFGTLSILGGHEMRVFDDTSEMASCHSE